VSLDDGKRCRLASGPCAADASLGGILLSIEARQGRGGRCRQACATEAAFKKQHEFLPDGHGALEDPQANAQHPRLQALIPAQTTFGVQALC